jgi:rhodanese-related sulfurtransferase
MVLALAGPAVRQARIAAAHIAGIKVEPFRGVIGTAVVRVFDLTAGCVGASEKVLKRACVPDVGKLYLYMANKVEWYPTFRYLLVKFLYSKATGKILGAQIVGRDGVEKRIDVLATAIQAGMTVRDLARLELAYAPQFNGPKDPVNILGFAATNQLDGLAWLCYPDAMPQDALVLDVREEPEAAVQGAISGALCIPASVLRGRLGELPKDRPIAVSCKVGQRGNHVMRMLRQNGFEAYNLSGGVCVWNLFHNPAMWRTYIETGFF